MEKETLTDKIFQLNAPYDNPYQGSAPRWLFVCSAGLLRSPTGAAVAIKHGINARSCGSNLRYALIPITVNLVYWAQKIFFVNNHNFEEALNVFEGKCHVDLEKLIRLKAIVLDIPDEYEYNHPELVKTFEEVLPFENVKQ